MTVSPRPQSNRAAPALVSVIMPTHNRPDELRIAIQSVLEQSHENFELIVVNDGGLDVSDVISKLNGSSRIHYVHLASGLGAAAARNVALSMARGEYVTYLDDDDWYDAEHLSTLVAKLDETGAAVAYTDSRRVVEERDPSRPGRPYVPRGVQEPYHSTPFSRDAFLVNNYIPILCIMHRRDCLDTVGMFDETLPVLEDWELWIRMSRHFDFVHIPTVTCTVRWRTDGTTTTTKRRREHWLTAAVIQKRYAKEVTERPELRSAQATLLASLQAGSAAHLPTCSLLVPFDSRSQYLREAIEAVVAGTRGVACELVLAACGDTPTHDEWLASLGGDVQLLRLGAETTQVQAWQEAASRARGEHVVFLPSDAVVRPGWLRSQLALVDGGATMVGAKLLGADGRICRAGGRFDGASASFLPAHEGAPPWGRDLDRGVPVSALGAQVVLMKRARFVELGGFQLQLAADDAIAELCTRCDGDIMLAGRSVAYRAPSGGKLEAVVKAVANMPEAATKAPAPSASVDVCELRVRAGEALKAGDLSMAEALLLDIDASSPNDGDSWVTWGVLHMQRGDFQEAERRFRGVAERGGDEIKGGTGVSIALSALGRLDDAWAALLPLADRYPLVPDVVHALFRVGVGIERFVELRERLDRYVQGVPDDDDMRYALATVCLRVGELDDARRHYTWLQRRVPNYAGLDELAERLAGSADVLQQGGGVA